MESTDISEATQAPPPFSERPAKLMNREQLAANLRSTAGALMGLTNILRQYPDSPKTQLLDYFERTIANTPLNPTQRKLLNIGLDLYKERHQAVKKVRSEHPNNAELFTFLFGRAPKGGIEVKEGPITLYFRCHNLEDYALIYNGAFGEPASKKTDSKEAKKSGGVALQEYPIPELKSSIMAEKAQGNPFDNQAQNILVHEEQHQILNLFKEAYRRYYLTHSSENQEGPLTIKKLALENAPSNFIPFKYQILSEKLNTETDSTKQKALIADFVRQGKRAGEAKAKNEMLAFFKEGVSIPQIQEFLLEPKSKGGLYDYFSKETRADIVKDLTRRLGAEYRPYVAKLVDDILVKEYDLMLRTTYKVLLTFAESDLSREQIVNLLMNLPLSRWKTAALILKESQAKQTQPLEQVA